jgi:hypothetical protein
MTFEEVEVESLAGLQKHIIIDNGDGSFKSFPADNSNPEFLSFLQALEKENDPYFLAWVEAGNDPDEFWVAGIEGMN